MFLCSVKKKADTEIVPAFDILLLTSDNQTHWFFQNVFECL
jgi:hypothetical protein